MQNLALNAETAPVSHPTPTPRPGVRYPFKLRTQGGVADDNPLSCKDLHIPRQVSLEGTYL